MKQSLVKIEENIYQRINKREFFQFFKWRKRYQVLCIMIQKSEHMGLESIKNKEEGD